MSKRKREEIALILTSFKKQKIEPIMYAKKRTLKKARKNSYSLKAKVERILDKRIETKFRTANFAVTDLLNNPLFSEISAISQGTGESGRIGNQLSPTYCESKIAIESPTDVTNVFVRIMVVQSRTGALVVADMPAAVGEAPDFDQYNIFYDRLVSLNSGNSTTTSNIAWNYSKALKRASGVKQTIQYDSTTAASDGGGIYIFVIADNANADISDGYAIFKYKDA